MLCGPLPPHLEHLSETPVWGQEQSHLEFTSGTSGLQRLETTWDQAACLIRIILSWISSTPLGGCLSLLYTSLFSFPPSLSLFSSLHPSFSLIAVPLTLSPLCTPLHTLSLLSAPLTLSYLLILDTLNMHLYSLSCQEISRMCVTP